MKIDRSTKTAEEILREETRDLRKFRPHEIYIIAVIAVVWVIFQLSLASFLVLESAKVRTIHLAFGLALSFLTIPCIRRPTKQIRFLAAIDHIPLIDYLFALTGAFAALYLTLDYEGLAMRAGIPLPRDLIIGIILIILLLEATRRAIGPALSIIAVFFSSLIYSFSSGWHCCLAEGGSLP